MKAKSIKDTVHGYVQIEEPFWRILDTSEFQRLRWIEQTSYRALYPSARHDRFIHSIGTYHLGEKAFYGLIKNWIEVNRGSQGKDFEKKYKNSFLMACLLHDIGHAPFSHTCEDLFNYGHNISNIDSLLNEELFVCVNNNFTDLEREVFKDDYTRILRRIGMVPKEHEVMSAIVIINNFEKFSAGFKREDREFLSLDLIVRSVLGCTYGIPPRRINDDESKIKGLKNCLIRLLNSRTVDVDKLDYLMRDSFMSGYDSVALDYHRLLRGLSFVIHDSYHHPAFHKSAISIINNVISAKNAQAKWIVNHPIIHYECYLLRTAIGITLKRLFEGGTKLDDMVRSFFSSASLSVCGQRIDKEQLCLLSDYDILHYLKRYIDDPTITEYFDRSKRKHPIWKSVEEYKYCVESDDRERVEDLFKPLITYLDGIEDLSSPKIINMSLTEKIKNDQNVDASTRESLIRKLDILYECCIENNAGFELVMIQAEDKFSTAIKGTEIFIRFDEEEDNYKTYSELFDDRDYSDGVDTEEGVSKPLFFYLYSKDRIESKPFLLSLCSRINPEKYEKRYC